MDSIAGTPRSSFSIPPSDRIRCEGWGQKRAFCPSRSFPLLSDCHRLGRCPKKKIQSSICLHTPAPLFPTGANHSETRRTWKTDSPTCLSALDDSSKGWRVESTTRAPTGFSTAFFIQLCLCMVLGWYARFGSLAHASDWYEKEGAKRSSPLWSSVQTLLFERI